MVHTPYWFSNDEVQRIQELNQNFMQQKDIAEMIDICFRKPNEGEVAQSMNSRQMLELIQKEYPTVKNTHSTKVQIGFVMKEMGVEHTKRGNVTYYKLVPRKAA